jgi:trehalose 6-phosphate synthase/phosphatase
MLVTSLRDGMNLVAKEFVAARADEDGVLVLSEFAGASKELHEALMVNPYATEQLTQVLWQALTLDPEERRWRMRALRRRVQDRTVENWANAFTHDLARATSGRTRELDGVRAVLQTSRSEACGVSIAVMYEGVLVPRGREPNCPDPELLQLLRLLVDRGVDLHVISGETHDVLDFWFDAVPVTLWAEHGLWRREPNGRRWQTTWISTEWMADVQQLLNQLTSSTPGSFVEERRTAFVWHFGRADDVLGRAQGQVLTAMLRNSADALGIEVRPGEGTVEIRPARLGATALRALVAASSASRRIVLFHDGTDEDGPRALRPDDMAVCVSAAPHSRPAVCDPRAVRTLLWELADKVPGPARPASPSSIAPSDSRLQATRAPLRSRLVAPVRRGTDGLDFLMR